MESAEYYGTRGKPMPTVPINTGLHFPLMIKDWRAHWDQGNFPFYFVQLASFNAANGNSKKGSTWAELREAQARTLSVCPQPAWL